MWLDERIPLNGGIFIVNYDSSGNALWAKSAGDGYPNSVTADSNGKIYLAGFFSNSSITFGTITLTNSGSLDMFIGKLCTNAPAVPIISPNGTTFCQGDSIILTSSSTTANNWSTGDTTQSITVSASGSYSVTVTDGNGCFAISSPKTIFLNSLPTASITPSGLTTFCQGNSITLTASSANSYLWNDSTTSQNITVSISGNYSVTVTDANGCSASSSVTIVTVNPLPTVPTITVNGTTLTSSSAIGNQWYFNGNIINGATSQTYTVTQNGNYTVKVTDGNGCSSVSTSYNFITIGIDDLTPTNSVTISPNPTNGKFIISSSCNINSTEIYNVLGEKVYSNSGSSKISSIVDLSNQPKGIYFVRVFSGEKIIVKKILVQ